MRPSVSGKLISVGGAILAGGSLCAGAQAPDIVWIMTDQQTARALSCAGNPEVRTPNLDGLAARGVRFVNAYCTAPLSGPSRTAMFTGLYPDEIGMIRNGAEFPEELRSRLLGNPVSAAGYECVYGGKWHVGPKLDVPEASGFRKIHPHDDDGLAEACAEWIRGPHDKPFFLVASFDNPHNICEAARFQPLPYGEVELRRPLPRLPRNFRRQRDDADVLLAEKAANYAIYPTVRWTRSDWRRYRGIYFALVEKVDAQIGKIIDAIDFDRTIVIFTSDHGDGTGAHRWSQKSALYEEVVNIPLIVCLPGGAHAGETRDQLVSNGIDIYESICDWTGADASGQGRSFRAAAEENAPGRDFVVAETTFDRGSTRGWMLRTKHYKYVLYDKGKGREQLFNMDSDRLEKRNLARKRRCRAILDEHRALLRDWMKDNGVRRTRRASPDVPAASQNS
ncbi:MAG: sulfatase-like hydrolase/transferase [Bacteroidales bacterium]|nr:sulfatase-like hydrolase/transferase [Bacteroidales bacterium]